MTTDEPTKDSRSFDEIIRLAFGARRIIRDETHPIYRELFGLPANRADDEADRTRRGGS